MAGVEWLDFQGNPLWVNAAILLAAALAIWAAGTRLAVYVDVIADRLGIGKAFIGMVLLGSLVSLPEITTGVTASLLGNAELAINNLLGAIPLQIGIFLAIVDLTLGRDLALTYFAPTPLILLQGILLALLLALAAGAMVAGEYVALAGAGLWTMLLLVAYLAAAYAVAASQRQARWQPISEPPEPRDEREKVEAKEAEVDRKHRRFEHKYEARTTGHLAGFVVVSALVVLTAGALLAFSGDAIAVQTGLGSSLVGGVLLALATSLPELSTAFSAARIGSYRMAVGEIFGASMLKIALLFPLDLAYRQGAILDAVGPFALFATVLGVIVTCVYLVGIVERRDRVILRMGFDSILALLLYAGGLVVLFRLG